jgi:hypothetical protein
MNEMYVLKHIHFGWSILKHQCYILPLSCSDAAHAVP